MHLNYLFTKVFLVIRHQILDSDCINFELKIKDNQNNHAFF